MLWNFYGMVFSESIRSICIYKSGLWSICMGILDYGILQCNFSTVFWFKKIRTNIPIMFIISIFVNIGMWFERFVITVTSLHRDFLPSSWDYYTPTWVDIMTFVGSFGLFFHIVFTISKVFTNDIHSRSKKCYGYSRSTPLRFT